MGKQMGAKGTKICKFYHFFNISIIFFSMEIVLGFPANCSLNL